MTDIERIASQMYAMADQLLHVHGQQITLWASPQAEYAQRCALCGLWIEQGTPIRMVRNQLRSTPKKHVGDYAHQACPQFDQQFMFPAAEATAG